MAHKLIIKEYEYLETETETDKTETKTETENTEREAVLFVGDFDLSDTNNETYTSLDTEEYDFLHLKINCYGGDFTDFIRLKSILELNQNFSAEIQSVAYGVGALVFLTSNTKIANKYSEMLICRSDVGNSFDIERFNKRKDFGEKQFEKILKEILKMKYITTEEYNKILDGDELWLDFDEMVKRGMVDCYIEKGKLIRLDKSKTSKSKK